MRVPPASQAGCFALRWALIPLRGTSGLHSLALLNNAGLLIQGAGVFLNKNLYYSPADCRAACQQGAITTLSK